jgi:hypothetical protein
MSTVIMTDAIQLVENLDAEAIRKELDDLERREDALRVLYRAAVARQRKRSTQESAQAG